jgi:hypothetical protein
MSYTSIMPGTDWYAVYSEEKATVEGPIAMQEWGLKRVPLVAWGIHARGVIEPLVTNEEGVVRPAPEAFKEKFVRIEHDRDYDGEEDEDDDTREAMSEAMGSWAGQQKQRARYLLARTWCNLGEICPAEPRYLSKREAVGAVDFAESMTFISEQEANDWRKRILSKMPPPFDSEEIARLIGDP